MSNSGGKMCFLCSKTTKKNSNISLHKFPSDIEMRSLWLKKCGLKDKDFVPNLLLCSKHFEKEYFLSSSTKILKPNAIPSRFTRNVKKLNQLQTNYDHKKLITNVNCNKDDQSTMINIRNLIESTTVPIVFNNMLDEWELADWSLEKWINVFGDMPLDCRNGNITCTKEPLWESKCSRENHLFSEIVETSKNIETNGNWTYFDYKYIGEKIDEKIFQSVSWKKFGYENFGAKDSTLWVGSTGAHTPCHQDLYGVNLVAQIYGKKRWILMPPEMGKYLKPSRVPYEESSCYSKINFSCPDNIKNVNDACKCVSIVLSPGDVLYVPNKWWHYVENLTTAISINTWIPVPKFDNMVRLNESVVRFMVSSICSGVSEDTRLQLLNPNEVYSSSMTTESINFIEQSIKMIEQETEATNSSEANPISLFSCSYKTYHPEQPLCKLEFDSKYHQTNHSNNPLKTDSNIDTSHRLLDVLCSETVISQIVSDLITKT